MKQYREDNDEFRVKANERCKANHQGKRLLVLNHYGHKCRCCGEDNHEFLTIDHINGDGDEQRKMYPEQKNNFYHWIVKNGYPDDLQVLCHNCHIAKHKYGGCPHEAFKP